MVTSEAGAGAILDPRLDLPPPAATSALEAIWLGSVLGEDLLRREPAASAAAVYWQTGLLEAMVDLGLTMSVLGGRPHSAWPRGHLFASAHHEAFCGGKFEARLTGYLNLPVLKLYNQQRRLRQSIAATLHSRPKPAVSFSYNPGLPEAQTGLWLQREQGVPWVCVVADYPESTDPRVSTLRRAALNIYGAHQRRWIREAAARVYLSWALFQEDPDPAKFHLDGGVTALNEPTLRPDSDPKRVIMFAGSLNALTGADLLLNAFRRLRDPRFELWISGRGNLEPQVREAARRDPRIRFLGMVSRQQLQCLMSQADAFVNPRPSQLPENRTNFPSKLLEYLSWGRPVISTLTPGISPSYRSLLIAADKETPEGLAELMERTLSLSREELRMMSERIRAYLEENLLWAVQARRLFEWLQTTGLLTES